MQYETIDDDNREIYEMLEVITANAHEEESNRDWLDKNKELITRTFNNCNYGNEDYECLNCSKPTNNMKWCGLDCFCSDVGV